MVKLILSAILIIFPTMLSADSLDKGYQAYKNKNYHEAYHHWMLGASQGDPISEYNLALLYYFGNGVKKDLKLAFEYCEKSAKKGLPRAQNNLSHMYADGMGIKQSFMMSYKWAKIAIESGYSSHKILKNSKNKLNKSQLKIADQLIEKFLNEKNRSLK